MSLLDDMIVQHPAYAAAEPSPPIPMAGGSLLDQMIALHPAYSSVSSPADQPPSTVAVPSLIDDPFHPWREAAAYGQAAAAAVPPLAGGPAVGVGNLVGAVAPQPGPTDPGYVNPNDDGLRQTGREVYRQLAQIGDDPATMGKAWVAEMARRMPRVDPRFAIPGFGGGHSLPDVRMPPGEYFRRLYQSDHPQAASLPRRHDDTTPLSPNEDDAFAATQGPEAIARENLERDARGQNATRRQEMVAAQWMQDHAADLEYIEDLGLADDVAAKGTYGLTTGMLKTIREMKALEAERAKWLEDQQGIPDALKNIAVQAGAGVARLGDAAMDMAGDAAASDNPLIRGTLPPRAGEWLKGRAREGREYYRRVQEDHPVHGDVERFAAGLPAQAVTTAAAAVNPALGAAIGAGSEHEATLDRLRQAVEEGQISQAEADRAADASGTGGGVAGYLSMRLLGPNATGTRAAQTGRAALQMGGQAAAQDLGNQLTNKVVFGDKIDPNQAVRAGATGAGLGALIHNLLFYKRDPLAYSSPRPLAEYGAVADELGLPRDTADTLRKIHMYEEAAARDKQAMIDRAKARGEETIPQAEIDRRTGELLDSLEARWKPNDTTNARLIARAFEKYGTRSEGAAPSRPSTPSTPATPRPALPEGVAGRVQPQSTDFTHDVAGQGMDLPPAIRRVQPPEEAKSAEPETAAVVAPTGRDQTPAVRPDALSDAPALPTDWTGQDTAAMNHFVSGFFPINSSLHHGRPLGGDEIEAVHHADAALAKLPDATGTTYRGLYPKDKAALLAKHQPGQIVTYPGYTSTYGPTQRHKAEDLVPANPGGTVMMHITGTGKRILGTTGESADIAAKEDEVAYPRGSRFRVDRVEHQPNGRTDLHMTQVASAGLPELPTASPAAEGGDLDWLNHEPGEAGAPDLGWMNEDPAATSAAPLPPLTGTERDLEPRRLSDFRQTMHAEAGPEKAALLLDDKTHGDAERAGPFWMATHPDMATGQGLNQGYSFTLDASKLSGKLSDAKPTWRMAYGQGMAEFEGTHNNTAGYRDAVRSVTYDPAATAATLGAKPATGEEHAAQIQQRRMQAVVIPRLLQQGWTKTDNPDGTVTLTRPAVSEARSKEPEAPSSLPRAPAAPTRFTTIPDKWLGLTLNHTAGTGIFSEKNAPVSPRAGARARFLPEWRAQLARIEPNETGLLDAAKAKTNEVFPVSGARGKHFLAPKDLVEQLRATLPTAESTAKIPRKKASPEELAAKEETRTRQRAGVLDRLRDLYASQPGVSFNGLNMDAAAARKKWPDKEVLAWAKDQPQDSESYLQAYVHQLLENQPRAKQYQLVRPANLVDGAQITIGNDTFTVKHDEEEGKTFVEDGITAEVSPHTELPATKVEAPKEPELPAHFFDADEAGVSGQKPGLFGQATFDGATGNQQGSMFHEPADVPRPPSEKIRGSDAALDPKNTGQMFPPKEDTALAMRPDNAYYDPNEHSRGNPPKDAGQGSAGHHGPAAGGTPHPVAATPARSPANAGLGQGSASVGGLAPSQGNPHPVAAAPAPSPAHAHEHGRILAERFPHAHGIEAFDGGFTVHHDDPAGPSPRNPSYFLYSTNVSSEVAARSGMTPQELFDAKWASVSKHVGEMTYDADGNPFTLPARPDYLTEPQRRMIVESSMDGANIGDTMYVLPSAPPVLAQEEIYHNKMRLLRIMNPAAYQSLIAPYKIAGVSDMDAEEAGFMRLKDDDRINEGFTELAAKSRATPPGPPDTGKPPTALGMRPPTGDTPAHLKSSLYGPGSFVADVAVPRIGGFVGGLREFVDQIRRTLAPQARGETARVVSRMLREMGARRAIADNRALEAFRKASAIFDKMSKTASIEFWNNAELGEKQGDSALDAIAKAIIDFEHAQGAEVRQVAPKKLRKIITDKNYLGRIWKNATKAGDVMAGILGRRPLEGRKGFLKHRSIDYFVDGINAGLEPATYNPVDMALLKGAEMRRFIELHRTLNEMKAAGLRKFVSVNDDAPEGWETVDDAAFKVYGPPTVTATEGYDKGVRQPLLDLAEDMGVTHIRKYAVGDGARGKSYPGQSRIETQYGTMDQVIAHELGHQIGDKFGLLARMLKDPEPGITSKAGQQRVRGKLAKQMRDLVDLRYEHTPDAPDAYKAYVREGAEKEAAIVQAWVQAREKFRAIAPDLYQRWVRFLNNTPKLKPLLHIEPSMDMGEEEYEIPHGGLLLMGNYYVPAEAAQLFRNLLSPNLRQQFAPARAWFAVNNVMNQANLSLSAFHATGSSINAAMSDVALSLTHLANGSFGKALMPALRGMSLIGSPLNYLFTGNRMLKEWYKPGTTGGDFAQLVKAAVAGGARAGMEGAYETNAIAGFRKALRQIQGERGWKKGNPLAKAMFKAPWAAMEAIGVPIMKGLVPRLKMGAFAHLARRDLAELGPDATTDQIRKAMASAWDSIDNRFGQLVYDNTMWNPIIRDIAMGSVRSVGWVFGDFRDLGNAAIDTVKQVAGVAKGRRPRITDPMAFSVALPLVAAAIGALVMYALSGKKPTSTKDYYYPQTGELDAQGRPIRLSLPTYMKDVFGMADHPIETMKHKASPLLSAMADIISNKDFHGTQVIDKSKGVGSQIADATKHVVHSGLPFSIQQWQKMGEDGVPLGKKMMTAAGFTQGSQSVNDTPAEALAKELKAAHTEEAGRTQAEADKSNLKHSLADGVRKDKAAGMDKVRQAVRNHQIGPKDVSDIIKQQTMSGLQYRVLHMDARDALKVWDVADDGERKLLRPEMLKKVAKSDMSIDEKRGAMRRLVGPTTKVAG